MAELYRATLGSYSFDVLPNISIRSSSVIRDNAQPNVRVAVNYEFRLKCRVPATTDALATVPPSAATNLGTFLASALHSRTLPTALTILDSNGAAIPQIGNVAAAGGWEDLQVTDLEIPDAGDQVGQLMAGAYFTLTFRARRTLADTDGICELAQVYEDDTDDTGATVRRLTSTIRLSQSAYDGGTRVTSAAIAAKLRLACPVGFSRTRGNNSWGFAARYPLYALGSQDGLVAETVSEVRSSSSVVGASGSTKSEVATRIKQDPEKGLIRTTTTADTTGADSTTGLEWVESQQPAESTGETLEEPNARHARGEWTVISPLTATASGKLRRVRRRYSTRGGGRKASSVVMSFGFEPVVQRGPWSEFRLLEQIEVFAQGATELGEVPLPKPLDSPWVLDGESVDDALPSIDEQAGYPSQRLWLRIVTRQYLWAGSGDPLESRGLTSRVMSEAANNLAVLDVP